MTGANTRLVTILFTDIEGSTLLWEQAPGKMRRALAWHDAILRSAVEGRGGVVVKCLGDGFLASFPSPRAALEAAVSAQLQLAETPSDGADDLKLRMRAAIHSGVVEDRDGDLFGPAVNLAARLLAAAHGGQILVSQQTEELLRSDPCELTSLRPVGQHRFRGVPDQQQVFMAVHPGLADEFPPLRSAGSVDDNLPTLLTRFIGRECELAALRKRIEDHRLVTITGPAGAGKTRLALQVATAIRGELEHGAWFVDLSHTSDAALVAADVARALRLREEAERALSDTLADGIGKRALLVILDNCEHVLEAVAALVLTLLKCCPSVRILATSREPLNLPAEAHYPLRALSAPPSGKAVRVEALRRFEAVQLFIERARLRIPDFEITAGNARAIADICARLDGLPLAIELAAARVRHLSVTEIAARVADALSLLRSSGEAAEPRQRTLSALLDWSYRLLSLEEARLFRRVSVFGGGWTVAAARQVCCDSDRSGGEHTELEETLFRLADKSLIALEHGDGVETRYQMLLTVRQYGLSLLQTTGEADLLSQRHCDWCSGLVQIADSQLGAADQKGSLDLLDREHDNFRVALEWCFERPAGGAPAQRERTEQGFRIAVGLWRFWWFRGHLAEGRKWLERALSCSSGIPERVLARGYTGAGSLAWFQGDLAAARRHHEASLSVWQRLEDTPGMAGATNNLAMVAFAQADLAQARALFAQSALMYRELNMRAQLAQALCNLGWTCTLADDPEPGAVALEESRVLFRDLGDQVHEATALCNLADLACGAGELDRAWAFHGEALDLRLRLQDPLGVCASLEGIARLAVAEGEYDAARRLFSAADGRRQQLGAPRGLPEARHYEPSLLELRRHLDEDAAVSDADDQRVGEEAFHDAITQFAQALVRRKAPRGADKSHSVLSCSDEGPTGRLTERHL